MSMTPHTPLIQKDRELDLVFRLRNAHLIPNGAGTHDVLDPDALHREAANEIERLRIATETTEPDAAQLIRAEALEVLEWIKRHYGNGDMNHEDFRVEVYCMALKVLENTHDS